MSLQPSLPLIDILRRMLEKLEAEPGPETTSLADLKRIVRERIARLEDQRTPIDRTSRG